MSVYRIIYQNGAKMMRPVQSRAEYLALRNTPKQKATLDAVRIGNEDEKRHLVQMNYSCLPNDDGTLKGSTRMSATVGMDIDHIEANRMEAVKETILSKKDELGLLMLERSARAAGYHLVFRRRPELTQEENLRRASDLLGVAYDAGAKDITRVFFTTTADEEELLYLDDAIFEIKGASVLSGLSPAPSPRGEGSEIKAETSKSMERKLDGANKGNTSLPSPLGEGQGGLTPQGGFGGQSPEEAFSTSLAAFDLCARQAGLDPDAMDIWGEHNWHSNLMAVLSVGVGKLMSREQLMAVVDVKLPNYSKTEDCRKLINYFYEKYSADKGFMNASLREINARAQQKKPEEPMTADGVTEDDSAYYERLPKLPQGVRDSVETTDPAMTMPVVLAICPAIGALATGVQLDVHGQMKGLNLISYIVGDPASGKGDIDPLIEAWMKEVRDEDEIYTKREEEWRRKKLEAKNKKEQPAEIKYPVRFVTLNNTVANIAERLANVEGKHAFSFTPEADTVAQKWKSAVSDFSVLLRQSYDGSRYDREAKSAEAVTVHIKKLLWNVSMCGTPDALYRVVSNYTDGFQSRIAIARTPDNTFVRLDDKDHTMSERQAERIRQIAHLLPLMQGQVVLPKLEKRGREWLEKIRLETMMNDDRVKARQRFRSCVTAQRMTCCIMLCKVAELLIQKHGPAGAEKRMKEQPELWKTMLERVQTPQMLGIYDVIADYLVDTALAFFRDRIEAAYSSRDYVHNGSERQKPGKNDSIYKQLDMEFEFEAAYKQSVCIKGTGVTQNSVRQMLKNWKKQGLIFQTESGRYRKTQV